VNKALKLIQVAVGYTNRVLFIRNFSLWLIGMLLVDGYLHVLADPADCQNAEREQMARMTTVKQTLPFISSWCYHCSLFVLELTLLMKVTAQSAVCFGYRLNNGSNITIFYLSLLHIRFNLHSLISCVVVFLMLPFVKKK
jgi:hypothetical protein